MKELYALLQEAQEVLRESQLFPPTPDERGVITQAIQDALGTRTPPPAFQPREDQTQIAF